ncbi:MAG TPA: hypothetical protein VLJ61_04435 [Pyrinomonadaceae bacterium]|nr:hypothetical protein [Pyrinomonadaceae bacterium]
MRRLTLSIVIALLALAPSTVNSNAARRACDCPTLAVRCSDTVTAGESTTFAVAVSNFNSDATLSYIWTVSAGTILSGQGTPAIVVDTTGLYGQPVEATVEVVGLPGSCERKSSCTSAVRSRVIGEPVDEYGKIPFEDEKARLDNFAIELQNDPTSQGYLICYGGKVGRAGEAWARCKRAKNYIATVRGIAPSRLVTVNGGYMENLSVWLWAVPSGARPPAPSPTVDPKEARIIKNNPKSRRRH